MTTGAEVERVPAGVASEADWHLLEYGTYGADLPVWREISEQVTSLADLGCGCGRVGLDLACRGRSVQALDRDDALLESLRRRSRERGLEGALEPLRADLSRAGWSAGLAAPQLAIAAMQLWQEMRADEVEVMAAEVRRWLAPGGVLAIAVIAGAADVAARANGVDAPPLRPALQEVDGWVLSSQVTSVSSTSGWTEVTRLRQQVSPRGETVAEEHSSRLRDVSVADVERELREAGFRPTRRFEIPPEPESVSCVAIVAEVDR